MNHLDIRVTLPVDLEAVLKVETAAFGKTEEANLVKDLLNDSSAEPRLSLMASLEDQAVGHILFTRANLEPDQNLKTYILAPLAVIPSCQKVGIGGKLIETGMQILKGWEVDWVFVLGHESYYPRHGFSPAMKQGFEPPFPIPEQFTAAWMGQTLILNSAVSYRSKVIPAKTLNKPCYWGQ